MVNLVTIPDLATSRGTDRDLGAPVPGARHYFLSSQLCVLRFPQSVRLMKIRTRRKLTQMCSIPTLITPPRNRGRVIFSLQFVCVSGCLSVCVCVQLCFRTKFQPNGCTDLTQFSLNGCLAHLTQILLKLVTMGQRSRSH